jgi:hypothetical protein
MIAWLFFALICTLVTNLYPLVNVGIVLSFFPLYLMYGPREKNPCPTANPGK